MRRTLVCLAAGMIAAGTLAAQAEPNGPVPVVKDLRTWDRLETRLGNRDPDGTGSIGPVQSDPTGVAGFMGPPGGYGESVGSYGALPQGSAGFDVR